LIPFPAPTDDPPYLRWIAARGRARREACMKEWRTAEPAATVRQFYTSRMQKWRAATAPTTVRQLFMWSRA